MTLSVLDLETTGLSPTDACIWGIAAVVICEGEIVAEWGARVQPALWAFQARHRDIPRRISGLSDSDLLALLDAPPPDVVSRQLLKFLLETNGGVMPALTSFNVGFDRPWLIKRPWSLGEETWGECVMLRAFEQMRAVGCVGKRADGMPKWPRLSEACEFFGVPFAESHAALNDARAAARLWLVMERGER